MPHPPIWGGLQPRAGSPKEGADSLGSLVAALVLGLHNRAAVNF
jgi:hypothetical protein